MYSYVFEDQDVTSLVLDIIEKVTIKSREEETDERNIRLILDDKSGFFDFIIWSYDEEGKCHIRMYTVMLSYRQDDEYGKPDFHDKDDIIKSFKTDSDKAASLLMTDLMQRDWFQDFIDDHSVQWQTHMIDVLYREEDESIAHRTTALSAGMIKKV